MKVLVLFCSFFICTLSFAQDDMYSICPLKNSEKVPKAKVYNTKGEVVDLIEYVENKKAILVFYRGGWCPYCMRHLSALQEAKNEIDALGYELIAITPDDFARLDTSVKKGNGVDYQLFSDKDVNAIKAFGIGWKVDEKLFKKYKEQYGLDLEWWSGSKHHILPVPAVFVIDNGTIIYQHVNPDYSKRLSTSVLLSFLKPE